MLSKNEFYEEEKDCADMLGVSIEEYRKDLEKAKCSTKEIKSNNYSFDNSIMNYLGLSDEYLKKNKKEV